ncbi:hypothetical protein NQD34_011546 [Periophthalmus magnuspinnatus]|nr:hypothetical protein NQD34_011546 [Periophthalmus magnuspinnatus]
MRSEPLTLWKERKERRSTDLPLQDLSPSAAPAAAVLRSSCCTTPPSAQMADPEAPRSPPPLQNTTNQESERLLSDRNTDQSCVSAFPSRPMGQSPAPPVLLQSPRRLSTAAASLETETV